MTEGLSPIGPDDTQMTGDFEGNSIESSKISEDNKTIELIQERRRFNPIQRIKRTLGFEHKNEIVSLPEIELPEYQIWLDDISFHPEKVSSYSTKIKDLEMAKVISELEQDSKKYYQEALKTTNPKNKSTCERLGYYKAAMAWGRGLEIYIEEQGSSLLGRMRNKIVNNEALDLSDREGLSKAICFGLTESLMLPVAGRFEDDGEDDYDYLRLIYSEIKKRNPNPHLSDFSRLSKYGLYEGHPSMVNNAPSFAILTFERTKGSKELLSFAIERLEKMGSIWGGGLVSGSENKNNKSPMVRNEVIRAGDCLILAARLSKLLGDDEKEKELYKCAYSFFGKVGASVSGIESLTGIIQNLARDSYPVLARRMVECARGAGSPDAEIWEKTYEKAIGKKITMSG